MGTDGLLCTFSTCNLESIENGGENSKCDPCEGDSGAPLFTVGSIDEITGEQKNLTLVGIHSGGSPGCIAWSKGRNREFTPKWWIKTPSFAEWIKCTQKYAAEGMKSQKSVETSCHDERVSHPPK